MGGEEEGPGREDQEIMMKERGMIGKGTMKLAIERRDHLQLTTKGRMTTEGRGGMRGKRKCTQGKESNMADTEKAGKGKASSLLTWMGRIKDVQIGLDMVRGRDPHLVE